MENGRKYLECLIDFASGQHGHFLEYVISKYIYNIEMTDDLFDAQGTCDLFVEDEEYRRKRVIRCGHYSSKGHPTKYAPSVIFIKHPDNKIKYDYILLNNTFFKAGSKDADLTAARIAEMDNNLKINWYDKLTKLSFGHGLTFESYMKADHMYEFQFESFFSFPEFVIELLNVAKFLNRSLQYNLSLLELWNTFIKKNQGYNNYVIAEGLFNNIVNGEDVQIVNDWIIHSYLNARITAMFNLYEQGIFNDTPYPNSTKDVHNWVITKINEDINATVY